MVETVFDAFIASFRLLFYFADWFSGGKERVVEIRCYQLGSTKPAAAVTIYRFKTRLKISFK